MLSLRSSLIVMFLLLVAAPLGVFWMWPHSKALQHELHEVKDRHLLIARNMSAALQRYHSDTTAAFNYVADVLLNNKPLPDARTLLSNLRFKSICLVDGETRRVIAGHAGTTGCPEASSPKTFEFLNAIAIEGQTVLSPVHPSASGEPVVCWVRRSGRHLVIGAIDTRYFVDQGRSITFGVNGHAVIVDQTGKVLAHPVPAWEKEMRDISKISVVREMLTGRTGIGTFYSPAFRDDMVAGFTSVEGPGWGVMVPQPVSELRETASKIQYSALSVFAMSLLLAALVACRAAMTLMDPVANVINGASMMAAGARNVRIPTPGRLAPRELMTLTASFNAMAENVALARKGQAEACEAADRANKSKTDFLRTVTHELRSPLNAIVGFSEILASPKSAQLDSKAVRTCVEDIRSGAKLLLSLTNDLLDLARIEAGQYQIADELVDLAEISARAARFVEPEAKSRNTTVALKVAGDLPAIRGDERALFQSVLNIASNAVKYGRADGCVAILGEVMADGGVRLTVSDDGPGIAPEDLGRVLEPFQRIESKANRGVRGTGLGLPIVRKLVALHGGTFRLESELGNGTRAIIELPADRVIEDDPMTLGAAA